MKSHFTIRLAHLTHLLRACFFLFTMPIAVSAFQTEDMSNRLAVTITGERREFIEYELIELDLHIQNLTNDSIEIPVPFWLSTIDITLWDEKRTNICCAMHGLRGGPDPCDTLSAGEGIEVPLDFGTFSNTEFTYSMGGPRLVAGLYAAQVRFAGVMSNIFEFRVTKASARDIEFLKTIQREFSGVAAEMSTEAAIRLLKQYPGHPYLQGLYSLMFVRWRSSKNKSLTVDTIMQSAIDFVDRYPKSPLLGNSLYTYAEAVAVKNGWMGKAPYSIAKTDSVVAWLQKLKLTYKDSNRMARSIDKTIESVRRQK